MLDIKLDPSTIFCSHYGRLLYLACVLLIVLENIEFNLFNIIFMWVSSSHCLGLGLLIG